jgi:hypothetical protein
MQWNISYDHQGIAHCDNIPRSSITSYLLIKQVISSVTCHCHYLIKYVLCGVGLYIIV